LVTKDLNLEIIICGAQKKEMRIQSKRCKILHSGEWGEEQVSTLGTGGEEYSQSTEYKRRNRSGCQKKVREGRTSQDSKRKRDSEGHSLSVERRWTEKLGQ
jgi:hypothetical protein